MKRRLFSGAFVAALAVSALSASALAAPNENACFGQGRSGFASANGGPDTSNGSYISTRKGTNPQVNADWILAECE